MGYNISFKVKVEGTNRYITVGNCEENITWDVREIITRSTGLEWRNMDDNGLCVDVMPYIEKGYNELLLNHDKYKPYEAENGWGTVSGTIRFFKNILDAWHIFSVNEDPEIVKVTTFWIE